MSKRPVIKTFALAALGLTVSLTALPALAADTTRLRVRGTIDAFDGAMLTVKTREGETDKIALKSGWTVAGVTTASANDIKPGDYVGIASLPKSDGRDGALEVLIFPAAMKGTGEAISAYDLKPNSKMTNATVSNIDRGASGQELTLSFKGEQKKMSVPTGTPIVTFANATQSNLVSGAAVIVTAEKAPDGSLSASRVAVGLNGIVPPM
jgi:hypothetical protein